VDPALGLFAGNLKREREARGLSQERLAEICGLHRTSVGLLERRERLPRLDTLLALTRGLRLSSTCDLLRGVK